ncbi:Signal transduction histidine kinase [Duganella sp. CF517]|uniref:sensor histidine kinase n=1 Tax=Duganella sp. CF517 TaxID=1881038 RepID=UPI0008CEC61E|nr:HAMP domain-containing sensor histidine kinase [Duganella sp. CF517]SEN89862.1 Signal transduction histidine kinase [Duganella sp. CF517]
MGRLFWKFFVCILLAQMTATVGVLGGIWLKDRSQNATPADIDTSPPAEIAINAAAATLEYGGTNALRRMLENMDRRRVYAVDDEGREMLGRIVSPAMLRESRALLKDDGKRRVVRQVYDPQGNRYMLFLPWAERQRGFDSESRQLLAGLKSQQMLFEDRRMGGGFGGPGAPGGPPPDGAAPPQGQAQDGNRAYGGPGMQGQRGPMGPRFEPLKPWVPIAAAIFASLLFSVLLAWYFSRPIRALRAAFDAAAGGDLAPRFVSASGKSLTELNDLGRDFDRMTARLRNLIDGQTRLLHDVSHELRSPLARLQAAIGLAHQQPDKIAASMERIERESVRMDKLVGELLTLARLEAGAIKASQEEISMADLLEQIADDASYEAASQQRTVVREGDADVLVVGQADLLGRAIENVVRNAIKHSAEGGEVQLQVRSLPDARQLCVRVLDRGPGVAPADLETIFQPFFRSANAGTEGHGLGLAIAQHVIEAHGGSIKATNRAGGGLCVEMILPVKL